MSYSMKGLTVNSKNSFSISYLTPHKSSCILLPPGNHRNNSPPQTQLYTPYKIKYAGFTTKCTYMLIALLWATKQHLHYIVWYRHTAVKGTTPKQCLIYVGLVFRRHRYLEVTVFTHKMKLNGPLILILVLMYCFYW